MELDSSSTLRNSQFPFLVYQLLPFLTNSYGGTTMESQLSLQNKLLFFIIIIENVLHSLQKKLKVR